MVDVVKPVKTKTSPLKNLEQFGRELAAVKPVSLVSRKDREKLYRKYMEKKHSITEELKIEKNVEEGRLEYKKGKAKTLKSITSLIRST